MNILCVSTGEARTIFLFKEVGSNMRTWAGDVKQTYIDAPVNQGNYPKAAIGAGMTVASTIFEAPDYFIAGIADNPLEQPSGGTFSRTRRDVGKLLKDAVSLRPIRTLTNLVRLPGSVGMDGAELITGFDRQRAGVRSEVQHALAA